MKNYNDSFFFFCQTENENHERCYCNELVCWDILGKLIQHWKDGEGERVERGNYLGDQYTGLGKISLDPEIKGTTR